MAKDINSNGSIQSQISRFIRDVGVPTFFAIALGYVMVQYWIAPQADLIKAMTQSNKQLGDTFEALLNSTLENRNQLADVVISTKDTADGMRKAYTLMSGVPNTRNEELIIMKEQSSILREFTDCVKQDHNKAQDSLDVIEKAVVN